MSVAIGNNFALLNIVLKNHNYDSTIIFSDLFGVR